MMSSSASGKEGIIFLLSKIPKYIFTSLPKIIASIIYSDGAPRPATIDPEHLRDDALQFQPDPESLLIRAETMSRVMAAIDRLPPKCKLIFKLIKQDGLKYKDVARLLDISIKTVEAQLSHCREKDRSGAESVSPLP